MWQAAPGAQANIVQWWPYQNSTHAWPNDFAPLALSGVTGIDAAARWWIKGVVRTGFTTAAVVSQIAEEPSLHQSLVAKYGLDQVGWANNVASKLLSASWNAVGQQSFGYVLIADPNQGGSALVTGKPAADGACDKAVRRDAYPVASSVRDLGPEEHL